MVIKDFVPTMPPASVKKRTATANKKALAAG